MRVGSKSNHNLEKIWADVQDGMKSVFYDVKMSRKRYIELYTHVYNYCTSSNNPTLKKAPIHGSVSFVI